jgi:heme A synthase
MTQIGTTPETYRPWLHRFAMLLTAVTFPLIASGGTVTSTGVGMVDPTWTFSPFKLFTSEGLQELVNVGMMIEHGHRQIGYIVGMMAIVFAVWTGLTQHGLRRLLGWGILLAVGSQGLLGAARIWCHARAGVVSPDLGRDIAMVHGVTGQLVLALMAVAVALLSRSGIAATVTEAPGARKVQRLAWWTWWFLLVQLVVGVLLRHLGGHLYLALHLFFGAAVAAHVILVFVRARPLASTEVKRPTTLLLGLLLLQVVLGVAAWWVGGGSGMTTVYSAKELTPARMVLTTVHQFLGALVLMTGTVTVFRTQRHLRQEGTT